MRLVEYAWPPGDAGQKVPLDLRLGPDLRLEAFAPACSKSPDNSEAESCTPQVPLRVQSGDVLPFTLSWRANRAVQEDYMVFVQLLDEEGALHAQLDRRPVGGFRTTSTWQPGEEIADNYGLRLPSELIPGRYLLIAGLYLPASLDRLEVTAGDGVFLGDHAFLGEVIVVEGNGP